MAIFKGRLFAGALFAGALFDALTPVGVHITHYALADGRVYSYEELARSYAIAVEQRLYTGFSPHRSYAYEIMYRGYSLPDNRSYSFVDYGRSYAYAVTSVYTHAVPKIW